MHMHITCLIFILGFSSSFAEHYCKPELCSDGKHIACNNTGEFSDFCGDVVFMLPMTRKRRQLILHLHNEKRNQVSLGNVPGYAEAVRMGVLKWDNELANLAQYNVKRCKMGHDECRNTEKYKFVGQNIGIRKTIPKFRLHIENIRHLVEKWFNEHKDCNQTFIDSYQKHPNKKKKIGHFTAMVNDECTHVGCAAILFETGPERLKTFLMTCNYSGTNLRNRPVYTSGPTGSQCTTGLSPRYSGLCSYRENINPNPI